MQGFVMMCKVTKKDIVPMSGLRTMERPTCIPTRERGNEKKKLKLGINL